MRRFTAAGFPRGSFSLAMLVVGLTAIGISGPALLAVAAPIFGDATVHGFTVGYWWAAGIFMAGDLIYGALIRGGTRLDYETNEHEPTEEPVGSLVSPD